MISTENDSPVILAAAQRLDIASAGGELVAPVRTSPAARMSAWPVPCS
ncbi:hypothetical protein [Nocardia sp. NPDC057455]